MFKTPRPAIQSVNASVMDYDKVYSVDYTWIASGPDVLAGVEKVVLMRPGSITHHSDFDQRYVALKQEEGSSPGTVLFRAPPNSKHAPEGFHMLFLVSDTGVPSAAAWIQLDDLP